MDAAAIRARLYDGYTATAHEALLELSGTGGLAQLLIRSTGAQQTLLLREIQIGERVGSTNRLLRLPDGASLEVIDNSSFDVALQRCGIRTTEQGIGLLESRWRYALLLGGSALAAVVLFLKFGLPAVSARAVALIPPSVDAYIGEDTLRVLDKATFGHSQLPAARQAQLSAEFAEITRDYPWRGTPPSLVFRTGGAIRANAIALPSRVVVLTDELVAQAKDDDELRGVLAHEVGHVVNRHAMRLLVQSSTSTLVLAGVFGDVSGAAPLTAAAPAIVVNAAYSRDFEREADRFAFQWMALHRISPEHLGDLLERLRAGHDSGGGFLASHPDIEERVRAAHAGQPPNP